MSEILKFRAGVADFDETSKICSPVPIKGEIVVKHSEEAEGFYDFEWKPIEKVASGNVETIELILIPDTTKWIHIKSSKNGRVFCLLFSSDEKYFFWLQDKHQGSEQLNDLSDVDKKMVEKFEEILSSEADDEESEANKDHDMEGQDQDQDKDVEMDAAQTSNQPVAHINDFLTKQLIIDHVQSLDPQSPQLLRLLEHLPEDQPRNKATLIECLRGPYFYQATDTLSRTLLEGFEASLTISSGFGYDFSGDGVLGFIKGARSKGKNDYQKDHQKDHQDQHDQEDDTN
ncbi:LANO_0G12442g1_1 [Lachancea nothofagi CBS 11611]|uniref:LANO_0G12442g1_1 n=1 Tax=Lachancea nothofagi CBS 11611 TaxID=1266666 RepID=A0A1G4KJQ4_9SACH|nr:LANO_0G12442g1_1 [Lachancea nothofagi CBS 11611]